MDLSRLVGDALLPFEPVFFEAGLTLESRVEAGIWVRGSGMQLAQAADILLDNARKYAAPGSAVSLRLERTGRWCLLRVATAGEPLTRQERQDVFKRFYRADPARAREGAAAWACPSPGASPPPTGGGSGRRAVRRATSF